MKYQLVLQFPAASIEDYDALILLENAVLVRLGDLGEVDGHDAGMGKMNLFVHTGSPERAYRAIKALPEFAQLGGDAKVAYRAFDAEVFHVLHVGLADFIVQ
jgi:hypothetical protein